MGQVNFLSTLDGNVTEGASVNIDGVAEPLTTDENGKASITLPAGSYNYSANDTKGNAFSGSFTIIKDAVIDVAVTFRNLVNISAILFKFLTCQLL